MKPGCAEAGGFGYEKDFIVRKAAIPAGMRQTRFLLRGVWHAACLRACRLDGAVVLPCDPYPGDATLRGCRVPGGRSEILKPAVFRKPECN